MKKETRPFVVVLLVNHKPKHYFGWNIPGAGYEQMKDIACAQVLTLRYEYKTASGVLFQYKPNVGMYFAVHEMDWHEKDGLAVADFYTPESMRELEVAILEAKAKGK